MTVKEFSTRHNPTHDPNFKADLQSLIETAIAGFLESPEYKAIPEADEPTISNTETVDHVPDAGNEIWHKCIYPNREINGCPYPFDDCKYCKYLELLPKESE